MAAVCAGLVSAALLTGRVLPRPPEIAYVSERRNNSDIYLLDLHRNIAQSLTKNPLTDEENPVWSPDGERIVYEVFYDGNRALSVMNAEGGEHYPLTPVSLWDEHPVWSPDGSLIAFNALDDVSSRVIYTVHSACLPPAATGCETPYRNLTGASINNFDFRWSPDSRRIVFVTNQGSAEIYIMDADGEQRQRLTENDANDFSPIWSPDGTRIAFQSDRDSRIDLYLMNADGSDPRPLTFDYAYDDQPAWSPDGRRIVFTSDADGDRELYLADSEALTLVGASRHKLTDNTAIDDLAVWSPDGTRIAFVSNRDGGNIEIYVMNADGSEQRRVTHNVGVDWSPAWRP